MQNWDEWNGLNSSWALDLLVSVITVILSIQHKFVNIDMKYAEAATGDVLWKKVFLWILQNSKENTWSESPF